MMATGDDNDDNDDGDGVTGDGRRVTKLTMMATTTTMATGGDGDNDGDGVTGNGATEYDDDDNSDGRQ